MDSLGMGAKVHLQPEEDDELLFQGPYSLDVPLAGEDVPVHQCQDGGSGVEVSVDGRHVVAVQGADPGYQMGPGGASSLGSFDMGEQGAEVDQHFLGLVMGDIAEGKQLSEGAFVVAGLSGGLVVLDDGALDVDNAVMDELEE